MAHEWKQTDKSGEEGEVEETPQTTYRPCDCGSIVFRLNMSCLIECVKCKEIQPIYWVNGNQ